MLRSLFLILGISLLTQCATSGSTQSVPAPAATPTVSQTDVAVSELTRISKEGSDRIDQEAASRLEKERKQLENVPAALKDADFKNFKFPFGRLRDGELGLENGHLGGTTYSLDAIYYVDLTGSAVKEAIVEITEVNCGGSCDGGDTRFYFYAVVGRRPTLIGSIETGAQSGG